MPTLDTSHSLSLVVKKLVTYRRGEWEDEEPGGDVLCLVGESLNLVLNLYLVAFTNHHPTPLPTCSVQVQLGSTLRSTKCTSKGVCVEYCATILVNTLGFMPPRYGWPVLDHPLAVATIERPPPSTLHFNVTTTCSTTNFFFFLSFFPHRFGRHFNQGLLFGFHPAIRIIPANLVRSVARGGRSRSIEDCPFRLVLWLPCRTPSNIGSWR